METEDINVIWLNQFQSKQNTDSNPTGTKWQWLLTEEVWWISGGSWCQLKVCSYLLNFHQIIYNLKWNIDIALLIFKSNEW